MPLNAIAYAIMKSMNNLRFGEEDYNNNDNLFRIPTSPKCFSVGSCKIDAQYSNNTIQCDTIRYDTIRYDIVLFLFPCFSFLYGIFYKRNRKHFSRVPIRYRNTRGIKSRRTRNCVETIAALRGPFQFHILQTSTRVFQHRKCFLFLNESPLLRLLNLSFRMQMWLSYQLYMYFLVQISSIKIEK